MSFDEKTGKSGDKRGSDRRGGGRRTVRAVVALTVALVVTAGSAVAGVRFVPIPFPTKRVASDTLLSEAARASAASRSFYADKPLVTSPPQNYLRAAAAPAASLPVPQGQTTAVPALRRTAVNAVYAGGYALAAQVGTMRGLHGDYKIMRLESAYAYDFIGHIYCANQLGLVFTALNRWAGHSEKSSRRRGAWWGAFGMMSFMEILNGFVPTVRLDPLDIPANAIGAWLADGYLDIVDRHPHLKRFSLQFGWKSLGRVVHGDESSHVLGNAWHDYPNGRFGLGYKIGPAGRPWISVFGTYAVSSMEIEHLKNQFGVGVELPVVAWASPLITIVPGGDAFVSAYSWLDERFMMPLFYVQILEFDTPAWSRRKPFTE